jgi:hypothetical protein
MTRLIALDTILIVCGVAVCGSLRFAIEDNPWKIDDNKAAAG